MSLLKRFFINFFTSGINDTADIEVIRKVILLNICAIIAIVAIIPLGLFSLAEKRYNIATIDFLVAAFIGGSIIILRNTKKYAVIGFIDLIFLSLLSFYNFYTGGVNNTGFIWSYFLPPGALFFFGLKNGTIYTILLVSAEILITVIPNPLYEAHYESAFFIRFIISLMSVFIITFFFEIVRVQIQTKLQEKNEQLTKTVSDLIETQKALQISEQHFRETADSLPTVICEYDLSNRISYLNRVGIDTYGFSEEDIKTGFNFIASIKPEDQERAHNNIERIYRGENIGAQQYTFIAKDGREILSLIQSNIIYNNGRPAGIRSSITDITKEKRIQEKLKAFAAKLEERNQELQEFIYIASHDLQEPLRKVTTFGDRLKTKYGERIGTEGKDYLERMLNATHRMQVLIRDLLAYSRVSAKSQEFTMTNIGEIVKEVISDLEIRIEQTHGSIKIGDLPTLEADATQIRQLFQNLIGNALKFHQPNEAPIVEVASTSLIQDGIRFYEITVSDNGIGIDKTNFERIFGVFQRLHGKDEYEGTGVGLAICKKIVERHEGAICVDSVPGKGTRFIIRLPEKQIDM